MKQLAYSDHSLLTLVLKTKYSQHILSGFGGEEPGTVKAEFKHLEIRWRKGRCVKQSLRGKKNLTIIKTLCLHCVFIEFYPGPDL